MLAPYPGLQILLRIIKNEIVMLRKFLYSIFSDLIHKILLFRYYWDIHGQSCKPFYYGNCKDSYNMYTSLPSCRDNCEDYAHVPTFKNLTEKIFCLLQPEFGNCNSYYPRWYFDINEMQCKGFSFSGCGGNHNRFDSFTDCAHACGDVVSHKNLTVSK
ncbi:hypothetical protein HF086_006967 [Spodoptera exigua]|uniref:BPTI/Kunitz inhibitor domain-containing protein n=1 Tax=Spodoptera exigua TaxID=7107 RepID=A0A922SHP6_SPOEX|nr:hypothetical protein HF086_006967 [Spodoptera exigua]